MRGLMIALALCATSAQAREMQNACMASPRAPSPEVCACAQAVANGLLSRGDQQRAAAVLLQPDLYITYKYASRADDRAFYERYRRWGEATETSCRL